jgi:acyl-CoA reductase-like NAD-dependent aldehyde dehydrogenase
VVSRLQQERVLNYIQVGIDEGATLAAQAPVPDDPELANGFCVAPTLFTDVTREMRIATEEIFGPVVAVMRFSDEDEAVAIANESEYGLTSAIYTADFRMSSGKSPAGVYLCRIGILTSPGHQLTAEPRPFNAPGAGSRRPGLSSPAAALP